jgi:diguanylate cyclase (GGDEF)-like protein
LAPAAITVCLAALNRITARRRYQTELRYLADHDPLTGLLNRRAFERRLQEQLARGGSHGQEGAVLVLDLDGFKTVNDTLGAHAGDELIVRVAATLASRLRDGGAIARVGGDEFAVLLPYGGREEAERVAEAMLGAVRQQRTARIPGGPQRPARASVGVATIGEGQLTAEEALINADLAMYEAKEAGGDRIETYARAGRVGVRVRSRIEWIERIRQALDEDRLVLHAQPVVEVASGRATQFELLVRIVGLDGELIPPQSFLPVAERFDLIREIDRWVFARTLEELARYPLLRPTLELNLSGTSLEDPEFAEHIGRELAAADVDPKQLVFEVTETAAIANIAAARLFAEQLEELGCRFALDDFGAGFGSFYYLKHLPFDFIKIDGEFVRNCDRDETDRLVIAAVVELARGLGKRTVAEFVGDQRTFDVVRELGVDYAQGFFLGEPAPLERWLRGRQPQAPHRSDRATPAR